MQAALLLVFLLILLIAAWFKVSRVTDGFANHDDFIIDRLKRFGDIGISLVAADQFGALGGSANRMVSTLSNKNANPLSANKDGLFAIIDTCESIQTMDCNAFDDPAFTLNCGVCLDIGTNSKKASIPGGGLVLLNEDKERARKESRISESTPDYTASVGFCPASKLVSTKAECLKLQRQLYCNKNGSYDTPGCAQCYSDSSFSVVDPASSPGIIAGHGTMVVIGIGSLSIQEEGFDMIKGINLSLTSPYSFQLRVNEGQRVKLLVSPNGGNAPIFVAGYLTGDTFNGEFDMDLSSFVVSDEMTGRKPRSSGQTKVIGNNVVRMSPGFGKTSMTLSFTIPFTFVDTTREEAAMCKDAPFVTLAASSTLLASNPCFGKGSGPGKFSLECLQTTWLNNGCTESGKGYPANDSTASSLMAKPDGTFRTVNDIADFVYTKALITSTGIDGNGKKQSFMDWSSASMFCTGVELVSPCDSQADGQVSPECIVYLWKNEGANNSLGPTYTGNGISLLSKGTNTTPQYCRATGSLSPIDVNGNKVAANISYWQSLGSVNNIKTNMNNLYRAANAQLVADDTRAPYFKQCYGNITFANRATKIIPPMVSTCSTNLLPSNFIITQGNLLVNSLPITQDYKLEFDIIPNGIQSDWASILHFTSTNADNYGSGEFGCRSPGIWFDPGSIALHVRLGDSTYSNWGFDNLAGLSMGVKSHVIVECKGVTVTVKIDNNIYTLTQPTYRYSGNVIVYGSDPWYVPAKAMVQNLCLVTTPDTADSRKTITFNNININGGGCNINTNIGSFPNISLCAEAVKKRFPNGNYAATWYPGQCWAIGPTDPYDSHFNPQSGWNSAYFRAPGSTLPGIDAVKVVMLAGGRNCLNFSQLVVLDQNGNNISKGRPTASSGQWEPTSSSDKAVDGNELPRSHPNESHGSAASCSANVAYWKVTLDSPSTISAIILYNRTDCCQDRLASFNMHFFNTNGDLVYWKPNMSTAPISVLQTNTTTNRVSEVKNQVNWFCYSARYKDIYEAFDAPFGPGNNQGGLAYHYNTWGRSEGRTPYC